MPKDRALTTNERALVRHVFGDAIALDPVRLKPRRFFPFQPRNTVMAPMGHIHFHPDGPHWRDDFALSSLAAQGLFIHEMVHVWQSQQRGRWWLPLARHPFCRYDYDYVAGKPFEKYGIEQQAEIVRHLFMAKSGTPQQGAPPLAALEALVPFRA